MQHIGLGLKEHKLSINLRTNLESRFMIWQLKSILLIIVMSHTHMINLILVLELVDVVICCLF